MNTLKIDEIDATILRMLLEESRTSFTDIAKECKITVGAVRMRYKKLWREGVINGEVTIVNPHCLGYRHIIDLGIITESENEKAVAEYLESKATGCPSRHAFGKIQFLRQSGVKRFK